MSPDFKLGFIKQSLIQGIVMIRPASEVARERQLFNKIKNNKSLHDCSVGPDLLPFLLHSFDLMASDLCSGIEGKLEDIEVKIGKIMPSLEKLQRYLPRRRKQKLYSFANSPEPKNYEAQYKSIQKVKQKIVMEFDSTQPKTLPKSDKIKPFQNQCPRKAVYFSWETQKLRQEIDILRKQLSRLYPNQLMPNLSESISAFKYNQRHIDQNTSRLSRVVDQQAISDANINWFETLDSNTQIQRYKDIIKQYHQQNLLLRRQAGKSQAYKTVLQAVLKQLQQVRSKFQVELLPCQACLIRNEVLQFLQAKKNKNQQVYQINQRKSLRSLGPGIRKNKIQNQNSYRSMEKASDEDSLLMQEQIVALGAREL